jgi:hypothetical protein
LERAKGIDPMKTKSAVIIALVLTMSAGSILGQTSKEMIRSGLKKTAGTPARTFLNINRLSTNVWDNGQQDNWTDGGLVYPKGSGKNVTFSNGLMWVYQRGANREVQVGGVPYWVPALQPGKILPGLVAEDPNLPKNRIYRVRPDIPPTNTTADISSELQNQEGTADQIYSQYHKDWIEWPWQDGAPYTDVDGDGKYDPNIDAPGKPGADQTIWYVANDLVNTSASGNFTSFMRPVGMEVHVTVWAYNRQDPLGYIYFSRYQLINKSQERLDSTYVTMFCDPDLGYFGDDLIGCDTTRSIVFDYNANNVDVVYAPLPPPAFGIDFFQGPTVPGSPADSAILENKWIRGKRNLPMTASYAFTASADELFGEIDWHQNNYRGYVTWMTQMFNLCKGLTKDGMVIIDPITGLPTKFRFAGDPVNRTGWIDGVQIPAGDRRMGMASGPFTMAPGDTQEVVIGEIVAGALQGGDRLTAVQLLKAYDDVGQKAYNDFFNLATAPPAPRVTAVELDREIVLTWGDDVQAVNATETYNNKGFKFQGYNVYQFPTQDPVMTKVKKLATFDIVDGVTKVVNPVYDGSVGALVPTLIQQGTDSGIKRSLHLKTDIFNGDNRLVNGTPYYFAVTSYDYNPDSLVNPSALENPPNIITVTPHSPNPGTRYVAAYGDTIKGVVQSAASGGLKSDGSVIPIVVDPTKLTGHTYGVSFDTAAGNTTWSLTDKTSGQVLLSKQTNQGGDGNYLITDGIQVNVLGPLPGMKSWEIPSGTRRFSPVGGFGGLGLEGLVGSVSGLLAANTYDRSEGTVGMAGNFVFGGIATSLTTSQYHTVLLKLAAVDTSVLWNPKAPPADANYSRAYRWLRSVGATSNPADPTFAPWIINKGSGYPYQDYGYAVPFSAWDMDVTPPVRLSVGVFENNVVGGLIDGRYWPPVANVGDNTASREFCFIFAKSYSDTPDPALQINLSNSVTPMMWVMTCTRRDAAPWAAGDQFQIDANHVNSPSNTFAFTAPQNKISDVSLAKDDIKQINVFPNPYLGVNPQELKATEKFMTFSHLPQKATIRIFNMGGVMVRKLYKDSPSQFFRWDLQNEYRLLVGSGLYIAYIDMPDLGVTKTLKLAVVQEQQVLQ